MRQNSIYIFRVISVIGAIAVIVAAGAVFALDSAIPSKWKKSPCFTQQSWEFKALGWDDLGRPIAPHAPYEPDGKESYANAYGMPQYSFFGPGEIVWLNTPDGEKGWTRHGFWSAEGMSEPFGLVFNIPTGEPAGKKRKLWLCYDIATDANTDVESAVFTDESKPFTVIYRVDWDLPSGVDNVAWRRVVEEWLEDEPTDSEIKVRISFSHGSALIDHVNIATGCIHAPGNIPASGTRAVDYQNKAFPFTESLTNNE